MNQIDPTTLIPISPRSRKRRKRKQRRIQKKLSKIDLKPSGIKLWGGTKLQNLFRNDVDESETKHQSSKTIQSNKHLLSLSTKKQYKSTPSLSSTRRSKSNKTATSTTNTKDNNKHDKRLEFSQQLSKQQHIGRFTKSNPLNFLEQASKIASKLPSPAEYGNPEKSKTSGGTMSEARVPNDVDLIIRRKTPGPGTYSEWVSLRKKIFTDYLTTILSFSIAFHLQVDSYLFFIFSIITD